MILDAREIVERRIDKLSKRVKLLTTKPKLVIIKIGDDYASGKYVGNKVKRCVEVGIESKIITFPENVTNEEVLVQIESLNNDDRVNGVLLQLPIPKHLNEKLLTDAILPIKDVDGFTTENMGKLVLGEHGNVACTPYGIIELLKEYDIEIEGKDVLIINRSNIVGKPLAHLFLKENATVTIAHSRTKNLKEKVHNADIVVTAIGKANFFTASDFKEGQTIVDVSINFDENGKMCGDVTKSDYEEIVNKKCNLTPVPNGVGQMTVLSLLEQTVSIAERKTDDNEI